MKGLVSVIIPIYNVEKYLVECLDSIVNQTHKKLQIILVDDGSPDNCGIICDEYAEKDNRITVIHKENGGVASAWNEGLKHIRGDWLYFLDSDDYLELDALECALKKAYKTNSDMVFFDYTHIQSNGRKTLKKSLNGKRDYYDNLNEIETFIEYITKTVVWNFIIKSSVVINKLNFRSDIYFSNDFYFKAECYDYISSFSYVKRILYHHRIVKGSEVNKYYPNYMDVLQKINIALHELRLNKIDVLELKRYFNSKTINWIDAFLMKNLFNRKNTIKFSRKIKQLRDVLSSELYQEAFKDYDKTKLIRKPKIYMILKNPPWFIIYFVYIISKPYSFIKARTNK